MPVLLLALELRGLVEPLCRGYQTLLFKKECETDHQQLYRKAWHLRQWLRAVQATGKLQKIILNFTVCKLLEQSSAADRMQF
jgi:hypothetical protein